MVEGTLVTSVREVFGCGGAPSAEQTDHVIGRSGPWLANVAYEQKHARDSTAMVADHGSSRKVRAMFLMASAWGPTLSSHPVGEHLKTSPVSETV